VKLYVGVTDNDWFRFLAARPEIDELNFWQPSGKRDFRALNVGDPFLFKLHRPEDFIVGGGIFTHFTRCPVEFAWGAFGEKNGVASLEGMRRRLAHYRHVDPSSRENFVIGCIILRDPFFLSRNEWIPVPRDFAKNVVQGKTYDATSGTGKELWAAVEERLRASPDLQRVREIEGPIWGEPVLARRRLGQGSFRMLVTDVYDRRCAVTKEKALPVLQAAHIRPVTKEGKHRIDNGVLLRSDVHTLFDDGYLTITPQHRLRVSDRLKKDFDNGENYYRLKNTEIWVPKSVEDQPNREFLEWHADTVFLG
jgi:HNH endonuclease